MRRHKKEKGVLDELAESVSEDTFISDLARLENKENMIPDVIDALNDIQPEKYSLHVWTEAAHYITKIRKTFSSPHDAKRFICEHLHLNLKILKSRKKENE